MNQNRWLLILALAAAIGLILILMAIASPSRAVEWTGTGEIRWGQKPANIVPKPRSRPRRVIRRTRRVVVRRVVERPRAKPAKPQCKAELSVVGDQAATPRGARNQAEKSWQQEVRFRYGEQYADARYAEGIRFSCVDSSIRNLVNRATEAVGINSQAKRCQMVANPCRAPLELEGAE